MHVSYPDFGQQFPFFGRPVPKNAHLGAFTSPICKRRTRGTGPAW
jgi:hypothetical protein